MCSNENPLKTVVFRHSAAALGVLAKQKTRLYMGSAAYTTVSPLCPMCPYLWDSSHSSDAGISLSAPADASLHHPLLIHFLGIQIFKISSWFHV